MAEHLDLDGLSRQEAQRYVQRYVVALKEVQRKRSQLKSDFEKWEQRAHLAKKNGRDDLEKEALRQCRALVSDYQSLGAEERQLDTDVKVLKKNLERLQARPERTVDAEALLQQLTDVVGEENHTKQQLSDLEAEQELEALKRKLGRNASESDQ